ncbi:inner membrane protein YiaA [soil metagenome]
MSASIQKPTGAFTAASWAALFVGGVVYLIGLWNASMQLNEKGYYFVVLMYGLFAAVSLQKSVRDRLEGVAVTGIYYSLCWMSLLLSVALLAVGLFNATLANSEKGFYAMAFLLTLFGSVAVQKNVRDIGSHRSEAAPGDASA